MEMKAWTNIKIGVVVLLSVYSLIFRKEFVVKHFPSTLYLMAYITDLVLSVISHFHIQSKFFRQFKCYNDDTTVIEFHCLLMNVSLAFLTFDNSFAVRIHEVCLLVVGILSLLILFDVHIERFKVPFTYCEFGTHVSILFILIFIKTPKIYLTPSLLYSFVVNHPAVVLFWLFLIVIMISVAMIPHQPLYVSVQRKSFHFVAAIIYTIGLHTNIQFLSSLSNLLVLIFIVFDFLRIKFAPNGFISQLFQHYSDSHQDPHLSYGFPAFLLLYVNTLPLLLFRTRFHCAMISTIITVDIGDAFAAIVGSYVGKCFPITKCGNKTFIGTFAFITAALLSGVLINLYIPLYLTFTQLLLISTTTGLMELTCENDNLILPSFALLFI